MPDLARLLIDQKDYHLIDDSRYFVIDLKYATKDNFTGEPVYENFNSAILHLVAFEKLLKAVTRLQKNRPNYRMKIFDALRPNSAQVKLWNFLAGTPEQLYVANPEPGSLHSFGFAIDLSIVNAANQELDMGTPFDDFTSLAQPRYQIQHLAEGLLMPQHIENRDLLRDCMEAAGFKQLPYEWWHFDALDKETVIKNYKKIN